MNDATDSVFRQIVARCSSPDVFFSEFVSVDSLNSASRHAMDSKLFFTSYEKPLIVQVWGNDPKNYEIQCRELSYAGYAGIDINMGCPVSKIIAKGSCSALINNRTRAKDIIDATKEGVKAGNPEVSVSVKTRIGFDSIDLSWIKFLLEQNLDCLIVHCRTTKEQSKVPNHFEVLPEIVKMRNEISPSTKLVANGDIASRSHGAEIAQEYGIDGVMIGRAIFHDPFVFSEQSPWMTMPTKEKLSLYLEHIDLFDKTWQNSKNPEVLKRFAKTYVVGFARAAQVREQIMALRSIADVREYISQIIVSG
ncbi:MAG: tRNA-dihydrouridine synthase [Acidimicrobiia bacterium]